MNNNLIPSIQPLASTIFRRQGEQKACDRFRDLPEGLYNDLMKWTGAILTVCLAGAVGCDSANISGQGPTPMRVQFASRSWDVGNNVGRELTSKHYRIYTTSSRPEILNYLPGFMEAAHSNYLDITGLHAKPAARTYPVYMMATRQEWAGLTQSIVGGQWGTYSSISAGGYCYKGVCVFWDIGGLSSMAVASHEGLHQLLHYRMKDNLPMWIEEGLATLSEGYEIDGPTVRFTPERNVSRFTDLRKAIINDWWIPLEKLLVMDGGDAVKLGAPERAVGYYGQVWALAVFLRTDPQFAPGRGKLLADAEAGRLVAALSETDQQLARQLVGTRSYNRQVALPLFKRYISKDMDGFERRYKAFARKLVRLR